MPRPTDNPCAIASGKQQEPKKETLSPRLHKRLLAYAAVAGAGLAASASSAEAEIVFTPVHSHFNFRFPLDLNHDGINDFILTSSYLSGIGQVQVIPQITGNKVVGVPQFCSFHANSIAAAALPRGAVIGSSAAFNSQAKCMAGLNSFNSYGPWVDKNDWYLGLAFEIEGELHYGWARITVQKVTGKTPFGWKAYITGYAYETIPGKPIVAGETGKSAKAEVVTPLLQLLALGAPGLDVWRSAKASE